MSIDLTQTLCGPEAIESVAGISIRIKMLA